MSETAGWRPGIAHLEGAGGMIDATQRYLSIDSVEVYKDDQLRNVMKITYTITPPLSDESLASVWHLPVFTISSLLDGQPLDAGAFVNKDGQTVGIRGPWLLPNNETVVSVNIDPSAVSNVSIGKLIIDGSGNSLRVDWVVS